MSWLDDLTVRKTCKRWNLPWGAHELTFSCFHRQAFLTNNRTRQYLVDAVNLARQKHGFHVWAYVFMPEHVHLLLWPAREDYSISDFLQTVKQSASRRVLNWLRKNDPAAMAPMATGWEDKPYQFWQDGGGYDRNIRTCEALRKSFTYIHRNPVVRKLVEEPGDWIWSSARDWEQTAVGAIPIEKESFLNSLV